MYVTLLQYGPTALLAEQMIKEVSVELSTLSQICKRFAALFQ